MWQAMEESHGGRPSKTRSNLPRVSQRRDRAAAIVGLSPKTLAKAKAVVESGNGETRLPCPVQVVASEHEHAERLGPPAKVFDWRC